MEVISVHLAQSFLIFNLLVELFQNHIETVKANRMLQADCCLVLGKIFDKIFYNDFCVWTGSVEKQLLVLDLFLVGHT